MASGNLTIIRSRMPKSKYFHYRLPGCNMDTCKIMYVGCEDIYTDFTETLRAMPGLDSSVACLMFEAGTEIGDLVNELELFIKNCKCEDVKVVLDIMNLYKDLGLEECQNILSVLNEYLICNWNIRYVFSPPLLSPSDSNQWEEIAKIQEFVNQTNVDAEKNPLFPFRWVMRSNKNKLLHHVMANWNENRDTLSLKGSRVYFRSIWSYIRDSMDAELAPYDLRSRIEPPSRAVNRVVNNPRSGRRIHSVPHGNHDARLIISHRRITRELEMCRRLMSMNLSASNTRMDVSEMMRNMALYFTVRN